MVICKIMGGLGNQMFCWATAYAFSRELHTELVLDLQIYHTFYRLRCFELDRFRIGQNRLLIRRSFGYGRLAKKAYDLWHDLKIRLLYRAIPVTEREEFAYQDFPDDPGKNFYLSGYWQNYRYFDRYRPDLIRNFLPAQNLSVGQEAANVFCRKPIAVHVRRGDYQAFRGGKCLSMSYYRKAISVMQSAAGEGRPFLIFTDDVPFCREFFQGVMFQQQSIMDPGWDSAVCPAGAGRTEILFADDLGDYTDIEEFFLMSMCSAFIIANSTFSWWAAYLSEEPGKLVAAPVVDMWRESYYPDAWIKIPAELEGNGNPCR